MSRHPLCLPLVLAAVMIVALVAMFLLAGVWDALFFAIAVSPLVVGGWRCRMLRDERR